MADYQHIMSLLARGYSHRQVEALAGCLQRTIAKTCQVLDPEVLATQEQVEVFGRLFKDRRPATSGDFVPID